MAVRGQLDSVRQPAFNVPKELRCTPGVLRSYHPRNYRLALRFNRGERPNISAAASSHFLGSDALLLTANKRPDFVNLDALRGNVADNAALILGASGPDADQKAKDSTFRYTRHAGGRPNGAAFDQGRDDRDFLFVADYVCHNQSTRQRFRIVNRKVSLGPCLLIFFGLRPSRLCGLLRTAFAFRVRHGLQTPLTADLPAL
jgi:hypothetical protein